MATLELSAVTIPMLPVQLALLFEMVPCEVTIVNIKLHEMFLPVTKLPLILDQIHPLEHLLILESMIDWIVESSGSVLHRRRLRLLPHECLFLIMAIVSNLHPALLFLHNKLLLDGIKPVSCVMLYSGLGFGKLSVTRSL
jgi:hypothetical protein